MKNLEQRAGYLNRHTNGLPDHKCAMKVIKTQGERNSVYLCEWTPFDKNLYTENNMPGEGYLGTAIVIAGRYKGIGFHAWEQNNSEFIWYDVVQQIAL